MKHYDGKAYALMQFTPEISDIEDYITCVRMMNECGIIEITEDQIQKDYQELMLNPEEFRIKVVLHNHDEIRKFIDGMATNDRLSKRYWIISNTSEDRNFDWWFNETEEVTEN